MVQKCDEENVFGVVPGETFADGGSTLQLGEFADRLLFCSRILFLAAGFEIFRELLHAEKAGRRWSDSCYG
jgi:hypothetical protein